MARLAALALALGLTLALAGCAILGLPPRGSADRVERLLDQGRAAEAVAAAREVPRRSPDYARAQALAARASALRARVPREALARGEALEASGKLLEAVRVYETALLADPRHQALLARLAAARDALARERERRRFAAERVESEGRLEAERGWAALAEIDPSDRDVRHRLRELAAARPALAAIHLERAKSLREDGRVREALEEADLAARLDPAREEARALAQREAAAAAAGGAPPLVSQAASGQPAEAAKADPKAKPGEPVRADATARALSDEVVVREALAAAQLATRQRDYPRALRVLARAEEQAPRASQLAAERAAVQRLLEAEVAERIKAGIAKSQREDLTGAIQEWGRALELDPENAVALDYRKKAQGMLKRIEEIREEVRQQGDRPAGGP